jgi:nucleotide-binding universal stress UspA family protein
MSSAPIVAGTDGSPTAERAVDRAAELARALGVAIHIVTSCSSHQSGAWMAAAGGVAIDVTAPEREARAQAEQILARSKQRIEALGVTTCTHLCEGDPADALITVAADRGAQMIVVGNRGMTGARRVLGSVPNRVSHHARCGVLIVPTCD